MNSTLEHARRPAHRRPVLRAPAKLARWLAAALLLVTWPAAAAGQGDVRPGGGIAGSVLDAGTGAPVEAAAVVLQPEVAGAFPAGPSSGQGFASASRAVLTDDAGRYRFASLPPGVYRLYVSRIGYRPYSVVVELRSAVLTPVALALMAAPIPLEPVRPAGRSQGMYDIRQSDPDHGAARLRAAEQRRHQYMTTDVREITHIDVEEAVTLGEPDVIRALQRLPGVTTRSDYTAELWTRGASWSQTRVYFDGVPLYNPLHALGVVSGVGSNAVGAVWFHPGTRSAAIAEGAAGVVDLQSRHATGGGELNVHGDVSFVSAGLALDQRLYDGRAGWMLSGRQTYLDWLTGLARRASGRDDVSFPYGFSEVAGRLDAWITDRSSLDASWLWERDHLTSTRPESADRLRADWGNAAGRLSYTTRFGRLHVRHTAAASAHDAGVSHDVHFTGQVPGVPRRERESDTGVEYSALTGAVWPDPVSLAGPAWTVGYSLERQRARYVGPQVLPVPRAGVAGQGADTSRTRWSAALPIGAVWGERAFTVADRLGVRAGLRLEAGDAVANGGPVRLSPRLSARLTVGPELALSAGASRVYQYAQAIAPGGIHVASLTSTDVWLMAGSEVPAIRSDIVTAGLEAWLAPGRTLTLNTFGRRSHGVAVSDPRPGHIYDRAAWTQGVNMAYGVEASVRQIVGRVTGSAAYTLSRSELDAAAHRYPAASDRRHVLNTTAMLRATSAFRAGFAFTAASGVPFTRTITSAADCEREPGCDPARLPWMGEPHSLRAPAFASLDLLVDWTRRVGGIELGAWGQLRNALGRENATIYTGDEPGCLPGGCSGDLQNAYERGMPRLPVLGLRVRR
jgi:hypothetical protein